MRYSKIFIALLALVFVCGVSFASVGVKNDGTMLGAATDIDFVGPSVTASGAYGGKTVTIASAVVEETADTPNTIEVTEDGTTFVATSEAQGGRSFDLPSITSANDGVSFKFVTAGKTTDSDGASIALIIQPQDADSIIYTSNLGDGVTIEADPADASDSYPTLELVAFDGNWYVQSLTGTWATGS